MSKRRHGVIGLLAIVCIAGCGSGAPTPNNRLRLDFDRDNPRSFISYYFGGLLSAAGTDPFAAGIIIEDDGDFFLDTDAFSANVSSAAKLSDQNQDGTLDWDELSPYFLNTYYEHRQMPLSIDSLGLNGHSEPWFEVSFDGVMTTATRRIRISERDLRAALDNYVSSGNMMIYPTGAIFVADHVVDNRTVETTIMKKRADGHWDFAAFDSSGARVSSTTTPPKSLSVPTQCVSCHLGSRLYEPEKSFPAAARPGPAGPRRVHASNPLPTSELVRYFDEHRKRSDGILGLYGTLYVAKLQNERNQGTLSGADEHLLESLGL